MNSMQELLTKHCLALLALPCRWIDLNSFIMAES